MISRIRNGLINRLAPVILGRHPRNQLFSFNYFNVSHICRFLEARAATMPDGPAVFLDVGAGESPYRRFFTGKFGRYIAVDTADSLTPQPVPGVEHHEGTAESIPLPDASVDVALFNQVLEHVLDPDASLREVLRVLKPGGVMLGSVPHISPVHLEPYDFRRYTDLGLRQMLENHGCTRIEIDHSGAVYTAAALLVTMDWVLSHRRPGQPQVFRTGRALMLSPLIGLINFTALVCDAILPDSGRSAANLCWSAVKRL